MPRKNPKRVAAGKRGAETRARNAAARAARAADPTFNPTIPTTMNSLSKLHPEILGMVFGFSGADDDTLSAFRGHPVIYQEALKVYWETKRCNIPNDRKNPWKYNDCGLSAKSLNSIKKIQLKVRFYSRKGRGSGEHADGWCGSDFSQYPPMEELLHLSNVSDLRLQLTPPVYEDGSGRILSAEEIYPAGVMARVRDCVAAFSRSGGLRTISCQFPESQMKYMNSTLGLDHPEIDWLNKAFGLNAKLRSVRAEGPVTFFWEAADGHNLSWWDESAGVPTNLPAPTAPNPNPIGWQRTRNDILNREILSRVLTVERSQYYQGDEDDESESESEEAEDDETEDEEVEDGTGF